MPLPTRTDKRLPETNAAKRFHHSVARWVQLVCSFVHREDIENFLHLWGGVGRVLFVWNGLLHWNQKHAFFRLAAKGLDHVAETILSYLDAKSLCAAERVCKEWLRVISDGMLWKKLIERMVRTDPLWRGLADRRGWWDFLLWSSICEFPFEHENVCVLHHFAFTKANYIFLFLQGPALVQTKTRWSSERQQVLQASLSSNHSRHRCKFSEFTCWFLHTKTVTRVTGL